MVTISKIRIKNFRSLVDETIQLSDFNCFVGRNDSGKSNVLKALNLFFNDRTDYNTPFDFQSDYSKFAERGAKQAKEITISIDIVVPQSFKESGIKTWTKIWRNEGLHSNNRDLLFKGGSKGFTLLDRIQYIYVPAVKSSEYFKDLLSDMYMSMTKSANSALKELNTKYSKQLQSLTSGLSSQLKAVLKMNSAIQMPRDLNALFRDLTFSTSDDYIKDIDLNHRGDGIKARHIPSILRYMQKSTEENRPKNSVSGSYIWGFEEPENGVEYLSCFEMANEMYSYRQICQMLITTHSPAFYMTHECSDANCFYVYKKNTGASKYETNIDVECLNEKIGVLPLVAPYIKKEQQKYLEQQKKRETELEQITQKYKNIVGKIIIITEGKTDTKHIKTAFEQLQIDNTYLSRLDYYDFRGTDTLGEDLGKLLERISRMPNTNIIIGIFDRDKHVQTPDPGKAYKALGNKVFRFNIPPLANRERTDTDKICIEHYYSNSEIETNTDFGHLYMGKDFNEYGQSNDKNWCFQNYAQNNSLTPISIIDKANNHMQRLCSEAQIITKDDFADYVFNNSAEFNFENFRKIFEVIRDIDLDTNRA